MGEYTKRCPGLVRHTHPKEILDAADRGMISCGGTIPALMTVETSVLCKWVVGAVVFVKHCSEQLFSQGAQGDNWIIRFVYTCNRTIAAAMEREDIVMNDFVAN